jgi:phospholipid/cholesterol/gamma-HCH transport system substrate-binding protein
MPRTRSLAWSELKIGILAVSALMLAALLIFLIGGQGGFFWQRYELRTRFPDVAGLKTGAVVRVAGIEVGKVTAVRLQNAEVEVVMEVSRAVQDRITTESRATLGALSLLGEPLVDISPSVAGEPIPEGGYLPSTVVGHLTDVAASATRGLEEATRIMEDIRAGRGTVGRLFADDALYREITEFVAAADEVASGLRRGEGTIGGLLRDPSAYQSLQASMKSLEAITGRIEAGEGSLGRLLRDDQFARSLDAASAQAEEVVGRLNRGEGSAGKFLHDQQLYDRLSAFSAQLESLSARLSAGEGTAGQLLHDRELYENMNAAASELRELVSDIRRDPRRYLNVRVSIF